MTFKPKTPGKPKAALSLVPAGLKYLLKAYWANSHDARPLGKVSGGRRPLQLPPSPPLNHLLKWKKCLRGKLPQFSVIPISPLGKSNPGSSDGMQTVPQPGVCIHVPDICSLCTSEKLKRAEERKDKWSTSVGSGAERVITSVREAWRWEVPYGTLRAMLPPYWGPPQLRALVRGHWDSHTPDLHLHRGLIHRAQHGVLFYILRDNSWNLQGTKIFLMWLLCPGEVEEATFVVYLVSTWSFKNGFTAVCQKIIVPFLFVLGSCLSTWELFCDIIISPNATYCAKEHHLFQLLSLCYTHVPVEPDHLIQCTRRWKTLAWEAPSAVRGSYSVRSLPAKELWLVSESERFLLKFSRAHMVFFFKPSFWTWASLVRSLTLHFLLAKRL